MQTTQQKKNGLIFAYKKTVKLIEQINNIVIIAYHNYKNLFMVNEDYDHSYSALMNKILWQVFTEISFHHVKSIEKFLSILSTLTGKMKLKTGKEERRNEKERAKREERGTEDEKKIILETYIKTAE